MIRQLSLGLWALALCACPPRSTTPLPDAGPLEFVGRACNVDAECGSLRCDKVRRQCICLSDESCKSPDPAQPVRYCNNYTGLCVEEITGCKRDADCGTTQYCDPSIRSCRPLKAFCESCAQDTECGGAQDNCVLDTNLNEKFCGKACGVNADCPRGATCQDQGGYKQCWPNESPVPGQTPSCANFKGCTPDSLRTCNADAECGDSSQRCDPARGKCVALEQVCPFGTACDPRARICVAVCFVDADCGDPVKLRCVDKLCEPIDECENDLQCPANKVCAIAPGQVKGQCTPFCQADKDCPIGQACLKVNDRYKCEAGCASNANCPLEQRCNPTTRLCEGPTVGGARTCQATVVCNTCELCDATKFECASAKTGSSAFPHCAPCTSPAECTGGTCVSLDDGNSYCLRFCGAGIECPQGFACLTTGTGQQVCAPSNRQCTGKCP